VNNAKTLVGHLVAMKKFVYGSTTITSKLSGTTLRRGCGIASVAAGGGPNCAVTR
jgi:hypothetical protein